MGKQATLHLREVPPGDIAFRPDNPRGETPDEIAGDKSFERLKDSVYEYGVLVPIVVHELPGKGPKRYILVDGERRLRAALAADVPLVPVHVAPSRDALDERVEAFHIHMLRTPWRAIATAKAVKAIYRGLERDHPDWTETELLRELRMAVGCSATVFQALTRAIRYSDDVLNEVDDGKLEWTYLVQIEESFVEQLQTHFKELLKELGGNSRIRKVLLNKARKGVLGRTRALMENIVPVVLRSTDTDLPREEAEKTRAFACSLLKRFVETEEMGAEEVLRAYDQEFPEKQRNVVRHAELICKLADQLASLLRMLKPLHLDAFPESHKKVRTSLTDLGKVLRGKVKSLKKKRR